LTFQNGTEMQNHFIDGKPALRVKSRMEWREWLEHNYSNRDEVWLVIYKKDSDKQTITKIEALDDAICFGWIDSLVKSIDDEKYMQKFTPRNPESQWSEINKKSVIKLEAAGLIAAPGQVLIDHARATGEWDVIRTSPKQLEISRELVSALDASIGLRQEWDKLPPSHQQQYLGWIAQAKREATCENRVKICINMLTSGQSPNTL